MYKKYSKQCTVCTRRYAANDYRSHLCSKCDKETKRLKLENIPIKNCKRCNRKYRGLAREYCSMRCKNLAQKKGWNVKCKGCDKSIYTTSARKKYCSRECVWRRYVHCNKGGRISPSSYLRKKVYEKFNYTCGYCKKIKHEKMIPLQLHHMDNNPMHTVIDNLVPLCLRCHMKTKYPHLYPDYYGKSPKIITL